MNRIILFLIIILSLFSINGSFAQTIIAAQNFEGTNGAGTLPAGAQNIWSFTSSQGSFTTSNEANQFYDTKSWTINDNTCINTFAVQNIRNFTNVSVEFQLGGSRINYNDELVASISVDNGFTWSDEIIIAGSAQNNGNAGDSWTMRGASPYPDVVREYRGNNPRDIVRAIDNNNGPKTVRITIPSQFTNVQLRITALNARRHKVWYIDNVVLRGEGIATTITPLTGGIAASPLQAGAENQAILGFGLNSNLNTTINSLVINNSSLPTGKITNVRLQRSTSNSYAYSEPNIIQNAIIETIGNNFIISGLSISLAANVQSNFFLVVTVEATVTNLTTALQPSIQAAPNNNNGSLTRGQFVTPNHFGTNYSFVGGSNPRMSVSTYNLGLVGGAIANQATPSKIFYISASSLTQALNITASTNFQISFTGIEGSYSNLLTLNSATINSQAIYVRYLPTESSPMGVFQGQINCASGGLSQTVLVSGSRTLNKPTEQAHDLSFGNATTFNSFELAFTRGNGNNLIIIARYDSPVNVDPVDGLLYNGNTVFGLGQNLGNGNFVVYSGSHSSEPGEDASIIITGIEPNKRVHFAIFEYNKEPAIASTQAYLLNPLRGNSVPLSSYEWIGTTANLNTSTNWLPTRETLGANDILIFNGNRIDQNTITTFALTNSYTAGQIHLLNGANIKFSSGSDVNINLNSPQAGDELSISSNSKLTLESTATNGRVTLNFPTGRTGSINGVLEFRATVALSSSNPGNQILSTSSGAVKFLSGSVFIQELNSTNTPFNGTNEPGNTVLFEQGSLYRVNAGKFPVLTNRKYANVEVNNLESQGSNNQTTAFTITDNNFIVENFVLNSRYTQGVLTYTFNFSAANTTPNSSITGSIIANRIELILAPTTITTINFNGTTNQFISATNGGSINFRNNTRLSTPVGSYVTLVSNINLDGISTIEGTWDGTDRTISGAGSVIINGTFRTSNLNGLTGLNASIVPAITLGTNSTIDYYASANQTMTGRNYANVVISGGGNKALSAASTINGTLYLNSGKINIGDFNLTLDGDLALERVEALNQNYVVTNGTGLLRKKSFAQMNFIFPVGDVNNYTPLAFRFLPAGEDNGKILYLQVRVNPTDHPLRQSTPAHLWINRHWVLSPIYNGEPIPSGFSYDVALYYAQSDIPSGFTAREGEFKLGKYSLSNPSALGGTWQQSGLPGKNDSAIDIVNNIITAYRVASFSSLTGGNGFSNAPSPVTLKHFTARAINKQVELTWATLSEINNDYFTIERSEDGKEFTEISKLKGAGNSVQELSYKLTDYLPITGRSYYRLKQTDFDGTFTYSTVQSVFIGETTPTLSLSPNPASSQVINLHVEGQKGERAIVDIRDLTGRLITNKEVTLKEQSEEIAILHSSQLKPGVYIVTYKSASVSNQQKLIIR